ncbi:outer membrane beta-barrel protein [Pontibacter amylolyticus]|uniref:Outer membrane protein beta-barrel domain-containing protein n=1 Tax=Pontibacter amylolyticus TaxID=1424080 RepID=A0ABQ1W0S3_9BACT|nr:outer membrane beta-barrel protein [Pontibacter amylolyticus]GGG09128.1 hypothetical protein GCM10011323_12090 [Pontibacter amylolyticus]
MIKFYTTLLLVLCSCTAYAQSDFRPGYIVNLAGDTLSGYVDYKESRSNNKFCSFKPSKESHSQQLGVDAIRAYGFKGDKAYEAKQVKTNEEELTKAFIEVLVKGRLSLYLYKARFFVEKDPDQLLELTNTAEEVYVNNTRVMKRSNEHIATLNTLMIDCQDQLNKIEDVSLSQRSLVTLVKNYNQCVAPEENRILKESKKWLVAKVGIAGSANTENLTFTSSDRRLALYDHARFDKVYYPSVGLVLNIVSPRLKERLSLQTEAFYATYDYIGYSNYSSFSEDVYYRNDFALELTSLKLNAAFRYTFIDKATQPYFNLGVSNRLLLNNTASRIQESESGNTIQTSKHSDTFLNKYHMGMMAGLGASYQIFSYRLFSELRYDKGMNIATPPEFSNVSRSLKAGSDTFSLIVGLYFNK